MYHPPPRYETDYQRITRLLNGNHRKETEAVEVVIRELLDVVQRLEDRLARFEEHYKNNRKE